MFWLEIEPKFTTCVIFTVVLVRDQCFILLTPVNTNHCVNNRSVASEVLLIIVLHAKLSTINIYKITEIVRVI